MQEQRVIAVIRRTLAAFGLLVAIALCPTGQAQAAGLAGAGEVTPVGYARNVVAALSVKRTDGRVEVFRGEGSLPLFEGDECRTEKGAKAFIKLVDGTLVALNDETIFVVKVRWQRELVTQIFHLVQGEIWVKTNGPKALEVETPVAVAAITKTEFDIRVLPDGNTILTVMEGLVEFGTPFGTCPIPAGKRSVGERGKKCTKPATASPGEVKAWIADVVR